MVKTNYNRMDGRDWEGSGGVEINYRYILLYQLKIVIENMTIGATQYMNAVKGMEILLIPYHDNNFKESMKDLNKTFADKQKRITRGRPVKFLKDRNDLVSLHMWYAEQKLRGLMDLIGRANLLPEKDVEILD